MRHCAMYNQEHLRLAFASYKLDILRYILGDGCKQRRQQCYNSDVRRLESTSSASIFLFQEMRRETGRGRVSVL